MRRVVITGMGTICGLGHNLNDVWNGLTEGKSGISTAESYDVSDLKIKICGEVKNFELDENILDPNPKTRFKLNDVISNFKKLKKGWIRKGE